MGRNANPFGTCKFCNRRVIWVRTVAGKNMPCDPELISYKIPDDGKGNEKIVTQEGEVVTANIAFGKEFDGHGYISHFATCAYASRARKSRK